MNHSDLKIIQACDLNLLLSLAVLIEEQSVSKSAERLDISQPAMSQNLKKLRNLFDLPLFVKKGQGIMATDKANALLPELKELLQLSSRLILQEPFDPAESHGVIRIAFIDDLTQSLVPLMLDKIIKEAPNVELEFIHKPKDIFQMLETGELDIAAAGTEDAPANIYGRHISEDNYCAAVAKHHPLAKVSNPNLEKILSFETCEYSSANLVESEVNHFISQRNLTRKVTFLSSSMIVMLNGLLAGKHVGFIPERTFQDPYWSQHLTRVPIDGFPTMKGTLYWHARVHRDPLIQWFKDYCLEITANHRPQ